MSDGAETRKGSRAPVKLKIKFRSATLNQFIERYSVDVSKGGIFIRTKDPLEVGTKLKFEFQLQDGTQLIMGDGTVVWIREHDPNRKGVAPGMGVRFDELQPDSQKVLNEILMRKAGGTPSQESVLAPPAPSAAKPAPSVATPAPSVATPAPSAATPAPSAATPAPSAATPAPSAVDAEDQKAEDQKAEEKKPEDQKAEEKKPEDQKAEEKKPEEKKAEDKKAEEKKAEEKKPEEKKAEDQKAEEKKPEDQKAEEKKPEKKKAKSDSAKAIAEASKAAGKKPAPAAADRPSPAEESEGGGGLKILVILLVLVLIVAGAYYLFTQVLVDKKGGAGRGGQPGVASMQGTMDQEPVAQDAAAQEPTDQDAMPEPMRAEPMRPEPPKCDDGVLAEVVSTPPGGKIFLNDKDLGVVTPAQVCFGKGRKRKTVKVELKRYKPGFYYLRTVKANQKLEVKLTPVIYRILVKTFPKRAEVLVDGKFRGNTTMSFNLEPNQDSVVIKVKKAGYKDEEVTLEFGKVKWRKQHRYSYLYPVVFRLMNMGAPADGSSRPEPRRVEPMRPEPRRVEPMRPEPRRVEPMRPEPRRVEPMRPAAMRPAAMRPAAMRPAAMRPAAMRPAAMRPMGSGMNPGWLKPQ